MKRLFVTAVISMVFCMLFAIPAAYADTPLAGGSAVSTTASQAITVEDKATGSTKTYANLQDALNVANRNSTERIYVTLAKNATYTLTATDSANHGKLRIYSHTVLDLNGSTIVRSDAVVNDGIIYNYPIGYDGSRGVARASVGGYDMSTDITIKNGTVDGGKIKKATDGTDLIRIDHASDIAISNITFKNCYDCHHLEFVGVKNGTVTNCAFSGFRYRKGYEKNIEYGREAFELDGAWKNPDGSLWARDTKLDMTSNRDCTVSGCKFVDVPSAVGSHHWSVTPGYKNSDNVVIENNVITAASKYTYFKTAITAGGVDNLIVRNNRVDGPYVFTIHAYRGKNITISGNEVDNSSDNAIMVNNKAKAVIIDGNTIKGVSGDDGHGISVADAAVASISKNAISSVKHNGINITSGTIDAIQDNAISAPKEHGISIIAGTVSSIANNEVSNPSHNGINFVTGAIGTVDGNVISNPREHGISVACNKAGLTIDSISGNTIAGSKHNGINLKAGSAGVVSKVDGNVITGVDMHGVSVINGKIKGISNNTITKAKRNSINVAAGTVSTISANNLKKSKVHGISVVGGKAKRILDNVITVSGKKGSGVCVTAGKVTVMSGNAIKAGKNGITVVGGKVGKQGKKDTGILNNTISKAKKGHGITVSNKATAANIIGNKITKPKRNGISISGKAKTYLVKQNTINVKKGKVGIYIGSHAVEKVKIQKNKITASSKARAIYKDKGVKIKKSKNKIKVKK